MKIKSMLDEVEVYLSRYRLLIGILVLIMLIVLSFQVYMFFDKQNQIIENGGFTDGKVKCVCNQEAWENSMLDKELNFTSLNFNG